MSRMSNEARSIYVERRLADRERTRARCADRLEKSYRLALV